MNANCRECGGRGVINGHSCQSCAIYDAIVEALARPKPVETAVAPWQGQGTVRVTGGHTALIETRTTRQYDDRGILRNEQIIERTMLAPSNAVPANQLRSFAPYQQDDLSLESGLDTIKRIREELNLSALSDGRL